MAVQVVGAGRSSLEQATLQRLLDALVEQTGDEGGPKNSGEGANDLRDGGHLGEGLNDLDEGAKDLEGSILALAEAGTELLERLEQGTVLAIQRPQYYALATNRNQTHTKKHLLSTIYARIAKDFSSVKGFRRGKRASGGATTRPRYLASYVFPAKCPVLMYAKLLQHFQQY
eukprot:1267571-Rhodomonas_salina.1